MPATNESGQSFGERLSRAFSRHGQLCVGIDPHPHLLAEWGLPDNAMGIREFGLRVVDAAQGRVGPVKPQVAFFERHGSAGFAALEDVLRAARDAGLVVIADAKRGDIGSTMAGYAAAWLEPGSPLEADAMTVSPFLGVASLVDTVTLALHHHKGLFILAATSNPEGSTLQSAAVGGDIRHTVSASIVSDVIEMNRAASSPMGSLGVVLGATIDLAALGIDTAGLAGSPATPVLAPGFGHQGAQVSELRDRFGLAAKTTVVAVSRSILDHGPAQLVEAITRQAGELAECLA